MATDLVCGMNVIEDSAKFKSEHMGKTYYFCSQMCKATDDKNPTKYVSENKEQMGHHSCCC